MANETMNAFYKNMNKFIEKSSGYLKSWSDSSTTNQSENADDYMPKKHIQVIEQLLLKDPLLSDQLINLNNKLRPLENNEERKKGMVKSYASVLSEKI